MKFKVDVTRIFGKKLFSFVDESIYIDLIKGFFHESSFRKTSIVKVIDQYVVENVVEVLINENNGLLEYIVTEPPFDDKVVYATAKLILENPNCLDLDCLKNCVENVRDRLVHSVFSTNPYVIQYYYLKVTSGYGAMYPLVKDPFVEEISVNADDGFFSVVHRKYSWHGWMKTNIYIGEEGVNRLVLSLARKVGKHVSYAHPIVEGLTNDNLRVSLTYGREVSRKGSSVVVRKKPPSPWTITRLINMRVLSEHIAAYLWLMLENKGFVIIVGGVSSGKTTLLQALLTLIPPNRRVTSIEDTPEIVASTGYWDPLVERTGFGEALNVDLQSLLKFSLRRRADYLVVGEVRGVEARLLVQASRLGHGVLTTFHADSAEAAIERLSSPPISIPRNLLSNISCIVVMENDRGVRRVRKIVEPDDHLRLHTVFKHVGNGSFEPIDCVEIINRSVKLSRFINDKEVLTNELSRRIVFLAKAVSKGVFELDELGEEVLKEQFGENKEV